MTDILKKTIYLTKDVEDQIMKDTKISFSKRFLELALIGLSIEDVIHDVDENILCSELNTTIPNRLRELVDKGRSYEGKEEVKITFVEALGYFNKQYKKKYPTKDLPILK